MQTFTQTFQNATTWELNVTGKYFTTISCSQPVSVRFFSGGKKLDLGDIKDLLAGLEVILGNISDEKPAFDRVQIDVKAGDTVQVGISNGQSRYNRANTSANILTNVQPISGAWLHGTQTVTTTSQQVASARSSRQYFFIQNKDTAGNIWVTIGVDATQAKGIKLGPNDSYEMTTVQTSQPIYVIGDIASNTNVITIEA